METILAIGYIAKLIDTILEGIPKEQRQVTAIALFWTFWPLTKINIPAEQATIIEEAMKKIKIGV